MEGKIIHDFEEKVKEQVQSLKDRNVPVLIYHFGNFKEDFIYRFSEIIEEKILANDFSYTVAKKVFSSVTEAINNIIKHGHSYESSVGGIVLYVENNAIKVIISNITEIERTEQIRSSIDDLNNVERRALEQRFYDLMKRSIISNTTNLGIGLLSIRMNSSSKINYKFTPLSEDLMIFSLEFEVVNN